MKLEYPSLLDSLNDPCHKDRAMTNKGANDYTYSYTFGIKDAKTTISSEPYHKYSSSN